MKLGKSKNKIARNRNAAKKLVKNSKKTAERKNLGLTKGLAMTTYREARSNLRSARKKNVTLKNPTLLQKLKELSAEVHHD